MHSISSHVGFHWFKAQSRICELYSAARQHSQQAYEQHIMGTAPLAIQGMAALGTEKTMRAYAMLQGSTASGTQAIACVGISSHTRHRADYDS